MLMSVYGIASLVSYESRYYGKNPLDPYETSFTRFIWIKIR